MISEVDLLVLQMSPWRVVCRVCQRTICCHPQFLNSNDGEKGKQDDPLGQGLNNES